MKSAYEVQSWTDAFGEDLLNLDILEEYLKFVQKQEILLLSNEYTEWHHIMPKCIDPDKQFSSQGINLRGSDHLRAHLLLVDVFKSSPQKRSLAFAVHQMTRDPKGLRKLTPSEYEEARKKYAEGLRGTHMSDEGRKHISETLGDGRLKGEKHPLYGKSPSEETRKRISEGIKESWTPEKREAFAMRRTGEGNPVYGKHPQRSPMSEEARKHQSEAGKGKIWITNGIVSTKIRPEDELPSGFIYSRSSYSRRSNGQEGKIWINNGTINRKIPKDSDLPEGFVKGG